MRTRANQLVPIIRNRAENRLYTCIRAALDVLDEAGIVDSEVAEIRATLRESLTDARMMIESRHRLGVEG